MFSSKSNSKPEVSGIFNILPWVRDRDFINPIKDVKSLMTNLLDNHHRGLAVIFVSKHSSIHADVEALLGGKLIDDPTLKVVEKFEMSDLPLDKIEGEADAARLNGTVKVIVVVGTRLDTRKWVRLVRASVAMVDVSHDKFSIIRDLVPPTQMAAA